MTEDNKPKLSDEQHEALKRNIIYLVDEGIIEKGDGIRDILKGAIVMLESMGYVVPAYWSIIILSGRCPYEEFTRKKENAA